MEGWLKVMKHVIIGVSAAGIVAAKAIRKISADDEIIMISSDEHVYARYMLQKVLSGEKTVEGIGFVPNTFFDDNNVKWIKNTKVNQINAQDKSVNTVDINGSENTFSFDKLLIATGASSFVPPISNFKEAKNLFALRDIEDVDNMNKFVKQGAHCVVIGSGLVGLDAVFALIARGVTCSVVEMSDRLLSLQLNKTAAKTYQDLFEKDKTTFYFEKKAMDSTINEQGEITAIVLDDQRKIECDFVIVAAGVRPNVAVTMGTDIAQNRGITVDNQMNTSVSDIYAAGDVTGLSGVWPNAMKQGEVAGNNMCGVDSVYQDQFGAKNVMNYYNVMSLSIGDITAKQDIDNGVITEEIQDEKAYKLAVIKDGVLQGVMLQGNITNTAVYEYLIKNRIDISCKTKSVFELTMTEYKTN